VEENRWDEKMKGRPPTPAEYLGTRKKDSGARTAAQGKTRNARHLVASQSRQSVAAQLWIGSI